MIRYTRFFQWPAPPLVAACLLLAVAAAAAGQAGRPTQDGRALDANIGIGTGGYNATRGDYRALNASNRYITGNVTGLGAFRGYSPIRDPSYFQDGLPSAGLSFFNRQSVSVGDVLAGQTQAGMPYYGRSETVVNIGGIVAGRNAPGSSAPLSTHVVPDRVNLSRPSTPEPEWRDPARLRRTGEALALDANLAVARSTSRDAAWSDLSQSAEFSRATQSPLFGANLARDAAESPAEAARAAAVNRRPDRTPPVQLEPQSGAPAAPPSAGSDVFSSLLSAVRAARERDSAYLGNLAMERISRSAGTATSSELLGVLSTDAREKRRTALAQADAIESQRRAMQTAARWAQSLLESPIASFASQSENGADAALAAGESAMKAGRYYEAESQFERARRFDPSNPLIDMARGHALAACGEYVSAVRALAEGLSRFPEAAALRLDLPALLGGAQVVELRCKDLERLLASQDNSTLRFLLGYLQYFSGNVDAGLHNLLSAARTAPADSFIQRFPRMLCGDNQPATLP